MYRTLLLMAGTALVFGQTVEFEVASVKAMPPIAVPGHPELITMRTNNAMRLKGGPGTDDPGRIDYSGVTIQRLLELAFSVRQSQIFGPDWLDTERFSIQAKLPDSASKERFALMVQNLLAERFNLRLHKETREMTGYALTVGKNGAKLGSGGFTAPPPLEKDGFADMGLPADFQILPGHKMYVSEGGRARLSVNQFSMQQLIDFMAESLARPVADLTKLEGSYSFTAYAKCPDDLERDQSGPCILGKLMDQLGLKLESRKEAVEVLVIDHVDKVPKGN